MLYFFFFFFQAEDGIRDYKVTGVQTCALPILSGRNEEHAIERQQLEHLVGEQQVTVVNGVERAAEDRDPGHAIREPDRRPGRRTWWSSAPGRRRGLVRARATSRCPSRRPSRTDRHRRSAWRH